MTTDPFLELRLADLSVEPDPEYREQLRERIVRSLEPTQGATMTVTTGC